VYSSFESMSAFLDPQNFGIHGFDDPDVCRNEYGNLNSCNGTNVWAERNYPCDSLVKKVFGASEDDLDDIGVSALQRQLYQCMMSQALLMKTEIERQRSTNSFGSLIWQLNENWPTGGWGVLEYGTDLPGQVIGGRWKPLMYFLKQHLFKDVIIACGNSFLCFVKNDGSDTLRGNINVDVLSYNTGESIFSLQIPIVIEGFGKVGEFATRSRLRKQIRIHKPSHFLNRIFQVTP